MNQATNQHPLGFQAQNLHQGPTVAAIHAEPRMKDVDVRIVTCAGMTTGDDGPWQPIRIAGKKKVAFDITTEKGTLFEAKQVIGRNPGKMPIIDMPFSFDPSIEARPLR